MTEEYPVVLFKNPEMSLEFGDEARLAIMIGNDCITTAARFIKKEPSLAHIDKDGKIWRNGKIIGGRLDIEVTDR